VTSLRCNLGLFVGKEFAPAWLRSDPERIARTLFDNSHQQIRLSIDASRVMDPLTTETRALWGLELHDASDALTGNHISGRLEAISVVFAHSLAEHPGVLGLMFDHGIFDLPGGDLVASALPREACAVFLGSIAALRGFPPNNDAYEDESFFTTVHELGHVFNLGHVGSRRDPSFMTQSHPSEPYPSTTAWVFHEAHQSWLSQCPHDCNVMPGCSPFIARDPFSRGKRKNGYEEALALETSLTRSAFLPFEPVELNVRLRVVAGHSAATIPDRIDPGYREFSIWIEDPSGERRLYRSPRHYCLQTTRRRIGLASPFLRDVSIFIEAGGYAFRSPGVHRVWAEFEPSRGRRIRSRAREVEVLPFSRGGPGTADLARALRLPGSRRLLYHRRISSLDDVARLETLCDSHPDAECVPAIRYALARSLSRHAERELAARAIPLLERGVDDDALSENQRSHCTRELERLIA